MGNLAAGVERAFKGRSKPAGKVVLSPQMPAPALNGSGGKNGAAVAQSVERVLGKDEVLGSNPSSS
jgi:hypothetical protein